jgi:hypothetical protein
MLCEKIALLCIPFYFPERWLDFVGYTVACVIIGVGFLVAVFFRPYADNFETTMDLSSRCVSVYVPVITSRVHCWICVQIHQLCKHRHVFVPVSVPEFEQRCIVTHPCHREWCQRRHPANRFGRFLRSVRVKCLMLTEFSSGCL